MLAEPEKGDDPAKLHTKLLTGLPPDQTSSRLQSQKRASKVKHSRLTNHDMFSRSCFATCLCFRKVGDDRIGVNVDVV